MALIESVFKRGAYDRTMSFHTIAEETRLPLEEVEHLVMKALRCVCTFVSSGALFAAGLCLALRRSGANSLCVCVYGSLKLIKGSLDQVDQKAQITWVQPRVLSREQVAKLAERLAAWNAKLHTVEERIAPEVLVSS